MSARIARISALPLASCVVVLIAAACSEQTAPPRITEPSFAKAVTAPTVTSTSPSYGHQGTVSLDVTINGSGFDAGTKAGWYLNGAPYPKITVNNTTYINSTQLVANISIASDAQIDAYDVIVTTSTTKQGIGSDCFVVTLAVPIPVVGQGINMAGQVVGYLVNTTKNIGALWDPQVGTVAVPNASTLWAIDENGRTVVGNDTLPALWNSNSGPAGPWTETKLSLPPGRTVGTARGLASDANGNAVFIAGSYRAPALRPVVWTLTNGVWQAAFDTLPTGVPAGWAQSVNAKGQSVGMDGSGGYYAIYWDSVGSATMLSSNSATAWSINGDGTVAVGSASGVATMWTRTLVNGVYGPWSGDIPIDTPSGCSRASSTAYGVNAAGTVVVGTSCGQPVAWNISGGAATSRFLLGTLGQPNAGTAFAVNNLANPNAAGGVAQNGSGFNQGALWKSF